MHVVRGFVAVGDSDPPAWVGPFVRLSYRGGFDSRLSAASNHQLGARIHLWLNVGSNAVNQPLVVPYNEASDRYDIELWGYPNADLHDRVDAKARDAMDRGALQSRPDLIRGLASDFDREKLSDQFTYNISPDNTMHPVRPLHLAVAWSDESGQ